MPSLEAAIALPEMDHSSASIARDLHLDVARAGHELFHVYAPVAKGRTRLRLAPFERLRELVERSDDTHASTTPTRNRFDDHRRTRRQRPEERLRRREVRLPGGARQHRDALARCLRACLGLIAKQFEQGNRRTDEGDVRRRALAREGGILAQEPITGMDRVAARLLGQCDVPCPIQVGRRTAAAQRDRFVRNPRVQ